MRTIWLMGVAVGLAGCAGMARNSEPAVSYVTAKSLDATAECLRLSLDEKMKARGPLSIGAINKIDVISPGKVYEISTNTPQGSMGENYVLRLTAQGPASTLVELQEIPTWQGHLDASVEACR